MLLPNNLATSLTVSLALTAIVPASTHFGKGMWTPPQMPELAKPLREASFQGDRQMLEEVTQPPSGKGGRFTYSIVGILCLGLWKVT